MLDLNTFIDETLLRTSFLGGTVEQWLLLLGAVVLTTLLLILLRRVIAWRLTVYAGRQMTPTEEVVSDVLAKTRVYFLLALALYGGAVFMGWDERGMKLIGWLLTLAAILQAGRWGNSLLTLWTERYRRRHLADNASSVTTMQAFSFLGRLVLWSVVLLLALSNLGVDVTALIAGVGVTGIAVGLALQNVLGDLFASLSIVLDKPFVLGDFLIVGEHIGEVEHIGLKSTRVRSLGGEQIIFSNGDLLSSRIRNYKRMIERRVLFSLGVTYQTPHANLAAIPSMLREIIEAQGATRFDRAHFKGYADSSLTFEVVYYVLSAEYNRYMDIQQAVNLAIYERFEQKGIDFAYPTQTVYLQPSGGKGAATNGHRELEALLT